MPLAATNVDRRGGSVHLLNVCRLAVIGFGAGARVFSIGFIGALVMGLDSTGAWAGLISTVFSAGRATGGLVAGVDFAEPAEGSGVIAGAGLTAGRFTSGGGDAGGGVGVDLATEVASSSLL